MVYFQEKRRYENPNRAFTYRMHGFESVVSPVKGAFAHTSGLTKPRGHTLLVSERPNYITILSLGNIA
jgi:nuclear factor related to kappa-B-binding protein